MEIDAAAVHMACAVAQQRFIHFGAIRPVSHGLSRPECEQWKNFTRTANNQAFIPNYDERHRQGERISTGFVESAVNHAAVPSALPSGQMLPLVHTVLAIALRVVLPSATLTMSLPETLKLSRLNSCPVRTAVNASRRTSRYGHA